MLASYVVVIGGSAGSLSGLKQVVSKLPADFSAAVLVVMHLAPNSYSLLAKILSGAGTLPAVDATHGEAVEAGHIYVAPPNHHLLMNERHLLLSTGPRENHMRPAIDPLFRTAAATYGNAVAGVVLSGNLGDGALGLRAIKSHGGVTIVQHPEEAEYPSMPLTAIQYAEVDHIVKVEAIADLLVRLSRDR